MYTVSIHHVCRGIGRVSIAGVSFVEHEKSVVPITELFYHSITQMLTAIKHVATDNFVFQQDSALAHHACNTVPLLQEAKLSTSIY